MYMLHGCELNLNILSDTSFDTFYGKSFWKNRSQPLYISSLRKFL